MMLNHVLLIMLLMTSICGWIVTAHAATDKHAEDHPVLAGHDKYDHANEHATDHVEGSTEIDEYQAEMAGITTQTVTSGTIKQTVRLYGRVVVPSSNISHIRARFPGMITNVKVSAGDRVSAGDTLAEIEANNSLKRYTIFAPIDGIVTERHANKGELAQDQVLFSLVNSRRLWAELRVFEQQQASVQPQQLVRLSSVTLYTDSAIDYIIPSMDQHAFVVAIVTIDNISGRWAPGMFVSGDVVIDAPNVAMRVDNRALQIMNNKPVVFVQTGNVYEARSVMLGQSNNEYTEILGGLMPADRYVVKGSFLIKADIGKSEAAHQH